ncbi:MAG: succinylglutamate-semialdehyde dehydrogenase [Gammaproteobacteria bacterium]
MRHETLFIEGCWQQGLGPVLASYDPGNNEIVWQGNTAQTSQIDHAVSVAQRALHTWSNLTLVQRLDYLQRFVEQISQQQTQLTTLIARETGKPLWEAKTEVQAVIAKLAISQQAYQVRSGEHQAENNGVIQRLTHRAHGVMAVLGPYNFPAHLPNGHIIPALLAGNTVIFKPSEYTPAVAELMMQCWEKAQLPAGVINLVQGDHVVGQHLVQHPAINGILFTGSYTTGKLIHMQLAGRPEVLLALEMGGNNPLIVTQVKDIQAAAYTTIQSAFITAGQRCTCARRLIVPNNAWGEQFLQTLSSMTGAIQVAHFTSQPEPFMGPVISSVMADKILHDQQQLLHQGAKILLEVRQLRANSGLLSPGIIDVTDMATRKDTEIFGPLLQVIRVNDFNQALQEANNTGYGLAAGIISDDVALFELFYQHARAGIINWNRPLTGASSSMPFGGVGCSGNYRPSAYYAADYCAYPVASLFQAQLVLPQTLTPGVLV